MALVSYSDSEGSEDEKPQQSPPKPTSSAPSPRTGLQPLTDKTQPRKIKVDLSEAKKPVQGDDDGKEPPTKRARLGGGGFSDFKSMLPPPKRSGAAAAKASANKATPRKVFSLKTGAEPGFDRSADEELRQLFGEQENSADERKQAEAARGSSNGGHSTGFVSSLSADSPRKGTAMMFKPLSVARNPQKKKKVANADTSRHLATAPSLADSHQKDQDLPAPAPKVSLFSLDKGEKELPPMAQESEGYESIVYNGNGKLDDGDEKFLDDNAFTGHENTMTNAGQSNESTVTQSLDSIASDLNLSASAKRQLLGRNASKSRANAINIVNFNTDQEYAANETLRASGEQVKNNPVRAIAPGKHSLRQLVTAASGQREALEESFAAGRRNKKEAGSKYGW